MWLKDQIYLRHLDPLKKIFQWSGLKPGAYFFTWRLLGINWSPDLKLDKFHYNFSWIKKDFYISMNSKHMVGPSFVSDMYSEHMAAPRLRPGIYSKYLATYNLRPKAYLENMVVTALRVKGIWSMWRHLASD